MPDYRALIEQVEARGGPLEAYDTGSGPAVGHLTDSPDHPAAWLLDDLGTISVDAICGVLRRDLVERGIDVTHTHHQGHTEHIIVTRLSSTDSGYETWDDDLLSGYLDAWLAAVAPD